VCLRRLDEIVEEIGLIKPITWRLDNRIYEDFAFNELLVFYLLPQKASFQRDGNNIKRNSSLVGPNCKIEIKFVSLSKYTYFQIQNLFKSGQKYKLLVNKKEETTTKEPTTEEPTTEEKTTEETTTKGTKTEERETTTKEGTAEETWSKPSSKPLPTSIGSKPPQTSIRPQPSPTSKSNIFVTVALIAVNVIL